MGEILIGESEGSEEGRDSRRRWLAWFAAVVTLALVPVLPVRYPPVLDLPQLLAQIDLAGRALADSAGPYRIQFLAPNKIGYPLLAFARLVGGNDWGPRLAVLLEQWVWIGALFWVARRRRRRPETAALASLLLWSGTFYGGFFHFHLGVVALAFWLPELERGLSGGPWKTAGRTALGGLLLFYAHALWLIGGLALVIFTSLLRRAPAKEWAARAAGFAPVILLAGLWYSGFVRSGWDSTLLFGQPFAERLGSAGSLAATALGGLESPVEIVVLAAMAAWVAAGWLGRWRAASAADRALALFGALLFLASLVLPDSVGETALFRQRWGWVAWLLLLLATPEPRLRAVLRGALVAVLVASFSAATWVAWQRYWRDYGEGLEAMLQRVGPGERLLELDYVRKVPGLWIHPLFQLAAYAQVERGAEIGYSFAETPSSLVVFRELPAERGWSRWLQNRPDLVTAADLERFDWVLVAGEPDVHLALVRRFPRLTPVEGRKPWGLYSVGAGRPAEAAP